MKILTTILVCLLANLIWSQCVPSDFPQEISFQDLYICDDDGYFSSPPLLQKRGLLHKTITFHFPDNYLVEGWYFFGNGPTPIYIEDPSNKVYTITYSSTGKKQIHYHTSEWLDGNEQLLFEITIKEESESYQSPDIIWELETAISYAPPADQYPAGSTYATASKGKGNAYIRLASGHSQIIRPLILVEGLDFGTLKHTEPGGGKVVRYGDNGWDVFTMGALEVIIPDDQEEQFKNMPKQLKDFNDAGFDLILLDFEDGATYIQKNAEVLKQLIRRVNAEKQADANGVRHENVIVGASMGAVISRYALAQMEKEGEAHCGSTYISFDGPHQGANIPLGIQALLWFNGTFFEYDAMQSDIEIGRELWKNINRPAPRQLLHQNLLGAYQDGNIGLHCFVTDGIPSYRFFEDYEDMSIDYNALHTELYEELEELGYPNKTWNIALTNGRADGQSVGFNPGASLLDADKWFGEVGSKAFKTKMWAANGATYSDEDFGENFSSNQTIFYGRRPLDFNLLGAPAVNVVAGMEIIGTPPIWDGVPGSVRRDIGNLIVPGIEAVEALCCDPINYFFPHATFMPTVSSLDINTTDLYYQVNINIDKDNPNPNLTPFSKLFLPGSFEPHVATNDANRAWVNEQLTHTVSDLASSGVLPNNIGAVYNYGYARKTVPGLIINNGGVLRINDEGSTAYLNEENAHREDFSVYTSSCNDNIIHVKNGGAIILGSDPSDPINRRGHLHITDGARVKIGTGGTLRLQKGSQLIIESGGILEIDPGATLDLWWAQSSIHIKYGGELRINGNFNFDGKGFFQFDEGNVLSFGSNTTTFKLHGTEAINHRFIQLNQDATLDVGNKILDLDFGQVNFETGSSIIMNGGAIKLRRVTFQGSQYADGGGLIINNPQWIDTWQARFKKVKQCIAITGFEGSGTSPSDAVKLDYIQFTNCRNGISISGSTIVTVSHCTFDGGANVEQFGDNKALTTNNVGQVKFYYNVVTNYNPFGKPIELNRTSSFRMRGGTIENVHTGIYVPCGGTIPNRTNVFLESGATIQNCTEAIFLAKGGLAQSNEQPDYGLVSMRCSKLINNSMGIRGTDILLDIDGCGGLPSSCMPNTFTIQNTAHDFFDVAYFERDVTSVNATNNYWKIGSVVGAPGTAYYSLRTASSVSSSCVPSGNIPLVSLNTSNALTAPPINCTNTPPDPNPKPVIDKAMFTGSIYQCEIPMNDGQPLAVNYAHARWDYSSDNDQDAYPRYAAMAAIPNAVRNASSQTCRHDIDVSRVMAYATAPFFASGNNDNQYSQEVDSDQALQVFPNPASESVQVLFGHPNFTVYVYDMLGKQYLSATMTNGASISVANWPSGLYLITAIAEENNERSTVKLIVN